MFPGEPGRSNDRPGARIVAEDFFVLTRRPSPSFPFSIFPQQTKLFKEVHHAMVFCLPSAPESLPLSRKQLSDVISRHGHFIGTVLIFRASFL